MTTIAQGVDTYVVSGDDRPKDVSLDQAVLAADNIYLAKFPRGFNDFDSIASYVGTWYLAEAVTGLSLRISRIAEDWQPSQVTTAPTLSGTPILTGVLGAIAANGSFSVDLAPLMQPVSDGTEPWYGVAFERLDAGADVAMWSFQSQDYPPSIAPVASVQPPQPTRLSPADGRAVSASQVLLRSLDFAADLDDVTLAYVQVQWSASTSFSSPIASDTQAQTTAQFDMAATQRVSAADGHTTSGSAVVTSATAVFTPYDVGTLISGTGILLGTKILTYTSPTQVTMTANATATNTTTVFTIGSGFNLSGTVSYWRMRVQSDLGVWSDWSDPESARYVALPTLDITNPPEEPGNVSADPDPLVEWDFSGTQTRYQLERTTLLDPATVLNPDDAFPVTSATESAYANYEIPDYETSAVDTLRVWDDVDREDVPGAPAYAESTRTWSVTDDATLHPPSDTTVFQLSGLPFVVVQWSHPSLQDFRIRRNGDNVSGLLHGPKYVIAEGEDGFTFQWIDYRTENRKLYDYRVQVVTDHRGSARGDTVSILVETVGSYLACPATGDYVGFWNEDLGEWVRNEIGSSVFGAIAGTSYYRKAQGNRMGFTTRFSGDILPPTSDIERSVLNQHLAFLRMGLTTEAVYFITPAESTKVVIDTQSSTEIDWPDFRRRLSFNMAQAGPSSYTPRLGDGGQVTTTVIDFESYSNGAAVTTGDPSGIITAVTGTVTGSTAAAMHSSTRGALLADAVGGSRITVETAPLANTIDIYSSGVSTLPGADRGVISWKAGGGSAGAIHLETTGKFDIRDTANTKVVASAAKVTAGQQFRVQGSMSWVGGVNHIECRVWIGLNMEGTNPDIVLTADVTAAAAPNGNTDIGASGGGYDWKIDDVRVTNTSADTLAALGSPEGGSLSSVNASAMTATTLRAAAVGIVTADSVKLAYSTTADSNGYPTSPVYSAVSAVDTYGTAQFSVTGLTAHTTYYFAVVDTSNDFLSGGVGSVKTLYAPNTSGSYTIGQVSCQTSSSTSNAAWVSLQGYAPDITVDQGDFGYWGGTLQPDDGVDKHVKKYQKAIEKLPSRTLILSNTSNENQISDHEVAGNGQYQDSDGNYDWSGQLTLFADNAQAMRLARPVVYADSSARGRYYFKDLFKNRPAGAASVRLFMLDCRTLDRSDGLDLDGASKTFLGAPQLSWLSANLLSTGLNILAFEGTWLATPKQATESTPATIDKWWNFNWEQVNTLVPMLSGKQVIYWGGDRHGLGYLHSSKNTLGGFTVCLASAMEMHPLPLATGEIYRDSTNADAYFGFGATSLPNNQQYGRITLADDNAGHITHTWRGWDAITEAAVVGPFTDNFTY